MNMITLKCPKCGAEKKLSLVDTSYTGPQRCWKCHELYTITIYNNQVRSCEPLSEEEYQKQEAKKNPGKMRNGIELSRREEPEIPQITPERRRDYTKPLSYNKPSSQEEPEKPPAPKTPPDRFRTFVPLEDTHEEPEKPQAAKPVTDRFRTFIPPAT